MIYTSFYETDTTQEITLLSIINLFQTLLYIKKNLPFYVRSDTKTYSLSYSERRDTSPAFYPVFYGCRRIQFTKVNLMTFNTDNNSYLKYSKDMM